MGVIQDHFYHTVNAVTPRKDMFFGKINLLWNTRHFDENNDV